jgi:hypothetical protein
MALFGVGLDVTLNRLNNEFKLFLSKNKGGLSSRHLKREF